MIKSFILFNSAIQIDLDLLKGQFDIFGGEQKKIQKPGSRGGKFWIDDRGNVRYDARPTGVSKKKMREEKEKRLFQEARKQSAVGSGQSSVGSQQAKEAPHFKTKEEMNDWYVALSESDQEKYKQHYINELQRLQKEELENLMQTVSSENKEYLKDLGYTEDQIDRMSEETEMAIVDKHLKADQVSIKRDGSYKVIEKKEAEEKKDYGFDYEVYSKAENGRPLLIKLKDGRLVGIGSQGKLVIDKIDNKDVKVAFGKTNLTASSWSKQGLGQNEFNQIKEYLEREKRGREKRKSGEQSAVSSQKSAWEKGKAEKKGLILKEEIEPDKLTLKEYDKVKYNKKLTGIDIEGSKREVEVKAKLSGKWINLNYINPATGKLTQHSISSQGGFPEKVELHLSKYEKKKEKPASKQPHEMTKDEYMKNPPATYQLQKVNRTVEGKLSTSPFSKKKGYSFPETNEFISLDAAHKMLIWKAQQEGKEIPENVLKEYPQFNKNKQPYTKKRYPFLSNDEIDLMNKFKSGDQDFKEKNKNQVGKIFKKMDIHQKAGGKKYNNSQSVKQFFDSKISQGYNKIESRGNRRYLINKKTNEEIAITGLAREYCEMVLSEKAKKSYLSDQDLLKSYKLINRPVIINLSTLGIK